MIRVRLPKGVKGEADVRVLPKTVQVKLAAKPDKVFELPRENCPKYLTESGKMFVRLSADGFKMYDARPWSSTIPVVFSELGAQRDARGNRALPAPKLQNNNFTGLPELTFIAAYRIVAGPCMGADIPRYLNYAFEEDDDSDGMVIVNGKLENDLRVGGINFDGKIPQSDNVLPWLEEKLQENRRVLMAKVEKGYIKELSEFPVGMKPPKIPVTLFGDGPVAKPAAKKPAAKKKK